MVRAKEPQPQKQKQRQRRQQANHNATQEPAIPDFTTASAAES
jgi:hypothetical protein